MKCRIPFIPSSSTSFILIYLLMNIFFSESAIINSKMLKEDSEENLTSKSHNQHFYIEFDPPFISKMVQYELRNVTFIISLVTNGSELSTNELINQQFFVKFTPIVSDQYSRDVIEIIENQQIFFSSNISFDESDNLIFSSYFTVKAIFLGYSNITTELVMTYDNNETHSVPTLSNLPFQMSAVRPVSVYQTIFTVFIIAFVSLNYVNMGCQLDLQIVVNTLRSPIGPLIGFFCQFTIMPLVSERSTSCGCY